MKRSEMVKKYIDILQMYGYPKDDGFMPRAKLADMMLEIAENNGMKPPMRKVSCGTYEFYFNQNADPYSSKHVYTNELTWTPENE